jgi:hypothetical protein
MTKNGHDDKYKTAELYMTMEDWVTKIDPTLPKEFPKEYAKWTSRIINRNGRKIISGAYANNMMTIEVYEYDTYIAYVNTFDYADMFMEGFVCRDIRVPKE